MDNKDKAQEPVWRSYNSCDNHVEDTPIKAQSHSAGKPSLCDIWRWLDQDFLMECVGQMQHPVEATKKYPKDNWKNGVGDQDFIDARIESAQRHLTKLATAAIMKEARDDETSQHEAACVMVNVMMIYHSLFGGK